MIVADANLVAYLLIAGERTAAAEAVWTRDPEWAAPILWRSEVRNVLATYLRLGHLGLHDAGLYMSQAESLFSDREYQVPSAPVLALCAASGCSAYDCEYVHLAQELGVPLVTADRRLIQKFGDVAVAPESYAA